MPIVKPFKSIRPNQDVVSRVAALPYDVYNRKEACAVVEREPMSFLAIDRAETQFPAEVSTYAPEVYAKARLMLDEAIEQGVFVQDDTAYYYIYELTMNGKSQTGIVACSSIDDYQNNIIKKHENTREEKEQDRIRHVDTTNAHTGPIFLAYRAVEAINEVVDRVKEEDALYDFTCEDGVRHAVWIIRKEEDAKIISDSFAEVPCTYIADGHHRCASAVKVGLKRRAEHPDYTGNEEFNYFLSVLFPDEQLYIMPYNRTVKDLNGYTKEEFLTKISDKFTIETRDAAVEPEQKGTFGMYLDKQWYLLTAKEDILSDDPVQGLDVSVLQDHLLGPILGIGDPRTDSRIDFIGGIRGVGELERRVSEDMTVAFSMYATSIQELLDVADAGLLMPPKSTWFEPKLRSGIFIHRLS
ncbi:MAG: DUF1015 domain-containing protein [Firmicutes bacterium]|nr:DUF1015 domain-containing protein [Bacillota bacterium]MBR7148897.1 DUF1015 domain-containing protein [Bacillota bacterium]